MQQAVPECSAPKICLLTPRQSGYEIWLDEADEKEVWLRLPSSIDEPMRTSSRFLRFAVAAIASLAIFSLCRTIRTSDAVTHRTHGYTDLGAFEAVSDYAHALSASSLRQAVFRSGRGRTQPETKRPCNPFEQAGELIDDIATGGVTWLPKDKECKPSRLVQESLAFQVQGKDGASHSSQRAAHHLHWLVNKTILLQGDSSESVQLIDFCTLFNGKLDLITPEHLASPSTYRKPIEPMLGAYDKELEESRAIRRERVAMEDAWEQRRQGWNESRPYVCDVAELGLTMISVTSWTLTDAEYLLEKFDFYHGPAAWLDRFHHITLPLLHSLAVQLGRPQIAQPDLIEISAGLWDARVFALEDMAEAQYGLDESVDHESHDEREWAWRENVKSVVRAVARSFVGSNGSTHDVRALDKLGRQAMQELRKSAFDTHHKRRLKRHQLAFMEQDLGLYERIRINEIGRLTESVASTSRVWSDVILYELKRAVEQRGKVQI